MVGLRIGMPFDRQRQNPFEDRLRILIPQILRKIIRQTNRISRNLSGHRVDGLFHGCVFVGRRIHKGLNLLSIFGRELGLSWTCLSVSDTRQAAPPASPSEPAEPVAWLAVYRPPPPKFFFT